MTEKVTVVFDGQVLRPDRALQLTPNQRYIVTIETETTETPTENAWDVLEEFAGTIDAPADWSVEHDHYLYGTPKRNLDSNP